MAGNATKKSFRFYGNKKKLAIILSILAFLILAPWLWFRYEDASLRNKLDKLVIPSDWTFAGEEKFGNRFCLDACPGINRQYTIPSEYAMRVESFRKVMVDGGYKITNASENCQLSDQFDRVLCAFSADMDNETITVTVLTAHSGSTARTNELAVNVSIDRDAYLFGLFKE